MCPTCHDPHGHLYVWRLAGSRTVPREVQSPKSSRSAARRDLCFRFLGVGQRLIRRRPTRGCALILLGACGCGGEAERDGKCGVLHHRVQRGVVAGLGVWFVGHLEQRTLTLPAPASTTARRNPFLAAERFLTRLGIPAESRSGRELLRQPPSITDTMLVRGLGRLDLRHRTRLRWEQ